MKKTFYIDDKRIINDWDLACLYFFDGIAEEVMDFALDNIIDIIYF